MSAEVCVYSDRSKVNPIFECPPCSGPPTHQIRNYRVGDARKRLGPNLIFCTAHSAWWSQSHPLHPKPELITNVQKVSKP